VNSSFNEYIYQNEELSLCVYTFFKCIHICALTLRKLKDKRDAVEVAFLLLVLVYNNLQLQSFFVAISKRMLKNQ
jgi:hypothetical protein